MWRLLPVVFGIAALCPASDRVVTERCTASLIPDHYPVQSGDANRRMADVYCLAYMRALLRRANEEAG